MNTSVLRLDHNSVSFTASTHYNLNKTPYLSRPPRLSGTFWKSAAVVRCVTEPTHEAVSPTMQPPNPPTHKPLVFPRSSRRRTISTSNCG